MALTLILEAFKNARGRNRKPPKIGGSGIFATGS